jgi:hypothetical protein
MRWSLNWRCFVNLIMKLASVVLYWCVCFLYIDVLVRCETLCYRSKAIRYFGAEHQVSWNFFSCRLLKAKISILTLRLESKLAFFCESIMKPSVVLFWCVCFLYESLLSIEGDKVIRCSASNFMKLSSCRLLQEKLFILALPLDSKLALFCESNNEGVSCSVLVCLFLLYARITPVWDSLLSIDGDKVSRCWASSFMKLLSCWLL